MPRETGQVLPVVIINSTYQEALICLYDMRMRTSSYLLHFGRTTYVFLSLSLCIDLFMYLNEFPSPVYFLWIQQHF